jgi:hypothetical protein
MPIELWLENIRGRDKLGDERIEQVGVFMKCLNHMSAVLNNAFVIVLSVSTRIVG